MASRLVAATDSAAELGEGNHRIEPGVHKKNIKVFTIEEKCSCFVDRRSWLRDDALLFVRR